MTDEEKDIPYKIRIADWRLDGSALQSLRRRIFIQELDIPENLEWDGRDSSAIHLLAENPEGEAIGSARLLQQGQASRICVLPEWRGKGVGTLLTQALLEVANDHHMPHVFLYAHQDAISFYQGQGFVNEGGTQFMAGVPHQLMSRTIESQTTAERITEEVQSIVNENLEQISQAKLGGDREEFALRTREGFRAAAINLISQARRKIRIFTYDLEADFYNNREVVEAVKALALRDPDPSVFILLQKNDKVIHEGHHLADLANRMPTKIKIFRPVLTDHLSHTENFLLVDDVGFMHRRWYTRLEGRVEFNNPLRAKELGNLFEDVWNDSEEDRMVRRLSY
jgi:predicted GNAT family N-acyltransferase